MIRISSPNKNTFEVSGTVWGKFICKSTYSKDGKVSERALNKRLHSLLSTYAAVKEIETGHYMTGQTEITYTIVVAKLGSDLSKLIQMLLDMDQNISLVEYNEAENELYEDSPFGRRSK